MVGAYLVTRAIVKPLHALHKGTEIIGEGNLMHRVGTRAKDEIGQLARSFNMMAGNLKKYRKKGRIQSGIGKKGRRKDLGLE